METIYLNENGLKIHRAGEHLLVKKDGRKMMTTPLADVSSVVVNTSVQFTTQAMEIFLDKNIDVIFISPSGKIRGQLFSQKRNGVIVRLAQYDCFFDEAKRIRLAKSVVSGKIINQMAVLKKYRWESGQSPVCETADMEKALIGVINSEEIDELMGYEGISAKLYFEAFRRMLKRDDFERREYRPAVDIVNSALNLGYAFLANESVVSVRAMKLDEELGFLHSIHYGRNSLALDFMEEFRAPFIDAWIAKLFNLKILNDTDFDNAENSFLLNRQGYRKFCLEYNQHLADQIDWRQTFFRQARKLKKSIVEGTTYESFRY